MKPIRIGTLCAVALCARYVFGGPSDEAVRRWIANSTVVFKGTVIKLNDSTFRSSNALSKATTDRCTVVRLDQLVNPTPQVSRVFVKFIGKNITVYASPENLPKLNVGDKATFFANSWLFGQSIALRAVGWLSNMAGTTAMAATSEPQVVNTTSRDTLLLESHLKRASAVIVGHVVSVRPLGEHRQAAVSAAGGPRSAKPISEHDPQWREAVVEVQSVEKGQVPQKRIVVVFAASRDVAWFKAPKFKKGQVGVIVLHKQQIPNRPLNEAMTAESPEDTREDIGAIYTALDPRDFVAANPSEISRIKDMLGK